MLNDCGEIERIEIELVTLIQILILLMVHIMKGFHLHKFNSIMCGVIQPCEESLSTTSGRHFLATTDQLLSETHFKRLHCNDLN